MSIKIIVADKLKFTIKGTIKNGAGVDEPFTFRLTCDRIDAEAIQAALNGGDDSPISDFFTPITTDWDGVTDADGKPLPYSAEALQQLFKIPGVARIALRTYLTEVGAKEKN